MECPYISLFRKSDFLRLADRLRDLGHHIDLDFSLGNLVADQHVDLPPYNGQYHLKLEWDKYVTTSIGLIITKDLLKSPVVRLRTFVRQRLRRTA